MKLSISQNVDQSKRNFIKNSGDSMMLALSAGYVSTVVYEGTKEPVINIQAEIAYII